MHYVIALYYYFTLEFLFMRIISGLAGGIRLTAPKGDLVRPTEDRVKESIFSSLGSLDGKLVLDLFSGSGSLGLEALSRGATEVYMIEQNPTHINFIKKNLAALQKAMPESEYKVKIIQLNVKLAWERLSFLSGKADIILADPPYQAATGQYAAKELLLDKKFADFCSEKTLLVLEHESNFEAAAYQDSAWKLLKHKKFGRRSVSYLKLS